jgi:hypothetical protein
MIMAIGLRRHRDLLVNDLNPERGNLTPGLACAGLTSEFALPTPGQRDPTSVLIPLDPLPSWIAAESRKNPPESHI